MDVLAGSGVQVSVRAVNEAGPGLPSGLFTVRSDGAAFEALAESERVLDTRTGGGPVRPGTPVLVDVRAPEGAVAVAYNLTVTGTSGSGYAVVYPAGDAMPGTSTINWTGPNQTRANSFVSGVSADGQVAISVAGAATQVVLDVQGYYLPLPEPVPPPDEVEGAGGGEVGAVVGAGAVAGVGAGVASAAADVAPPLVGDGISESAGLVPVVPVRAHDSRDNGGAVATGSSVKVPLADFVPAGATAVAYTLTETGTQGSGFLAVGLPGAMMPPTSVLNWSGTGVTMANSSVAALDDQQAIEVFAGGSGGSTQVVVDVIGYFAPFDLDPDALAFAAIDPERTYDSRAEGGPLAGGESRVTTIGVPGMPLDVPAVAVNLTVTGTVGSGFLTLASADAAVQPAASTINWTESGTTIANGTVVGAVDDAIRTFASGGSTQYITDIAGYYTANPVG